MRDDVDSLQRGQQHIAVGNIALDEFGGGRKITGTAMGMDPGHQAVEYSHLKAVVQKPVG